MASSDQGPYGTDNRLPIVNALPFTEILSSAMELPGVDGMRDIKVCTCRFDPGRFSDALFPRLGIDCPSNIRKAVVQRKAEFLAGRYAAQQALFMAGFDNCQVPIGSHRNPLWPDQIVGSITHNRRIAICAVANSRSVSALGIDIETCIESNMADRIKYSVIDREEESLLLELPYPFARAFSLSFSAKESLFKALYPAVGRYFDFDSAKLQHICPREGLFTLSLQQDISPSLKSGQILAGHYRFSESDVVTTVILPPRIDFLRSPRPPD